MKMSRRAWHAMAASLLLVGTAWGQQLESTPRPAGEAPPQSYLGKTVVDFRQLLAGPPAVDSILDQADRRAIDEFQRVDEPRWHVAEADDRLVYPRFEDAFGRRIDRQNTPALVALLNRAIRDVSATTFAAKGQFSRPRPFQRMQLERVCDEAAPPKAEAHPTSGSSYPSGHSAYGWAVAMILARVARDRAPALMTRAAEYAESRLVCGVHFPSDIYAGQTVAAAVVSRLDASPEFRSDLDRARAEIK
ncbi:MAG: phosphatase PAP2 family protein [Gammaproteobacteria bacterium]